MAEDVMRTSTVIVIPYNRCWIVARVRPFVCVCALRISMWLASYHTFICKVSLFYWKQSKCWGGWHMATDWAPFILIVLAKWSISVRMVIEHTERWPSLRPTGYFWIFDSKIDDQSILLSFTLTAMMLLLLLLYSAFFFFHNRGWVQFYV